MRLGAPLPSRGPAFDPDVPEPGCYRVTLCQGAPSSAVRIWLGFSIDPETGEEMRDRPYHYQCTLNGARVPLDRCWPGCAREMISSDEHDRLVERNRTLDESSPFYDPARRVDLRTAPPPSF
jgi:hypothetical protein